MAKRPRSRNQMTDQYMPTLDSSPGTASYREDPEDNALILIGAPGMCACGCTGSINPSANQFIQGHDQTLKAKLARAHVAGAEVIMVGDDLRVGTDAYGYADRVLSAAGVAQVQRMAYNLVERQRVRREREQKANAKNTEAE